MNIPVDHVKINILFYSKIYINTLQIQYRTVFSNHNLRVNMNGLAKMMRKMTTTHVVSILAVLAIGYAVYQYSMKKSMALDGMSGSPISASASSVDQIKNFPELPTVPSCVDNAPAQGKGPMGAVENLGQQPEFASAQGIGTSTHNMPTSCQRSQVIDPKELMPKGESAWSELNPMGGGELKHVNMLSATSISGIQTKGSSLRNANLQLRPDPVIPRTYTFPIHQSTITHDDRPGFEMEC